MIKFDPYTDGAHPMFRQTDAAMLTREETQRLMNWCGYQEEALWDNMSLQDILNVWHASRDWDTWEGWAQEEGDTARRAWNDVVRDPAQHMRLVEGAQ